MGCRDNVIGDTPMRQAKKHNRPTATLRQSTKNQQQGLLLALLERIQPDDDFMMRLEGLPC
jgi:hypothetical protein